MQKCCEFVTKFKSLKVAFNLGFLLLLLDIITKLAVVLRLPLGGVIDVLPFFNIVRVHNYGVTFGILSGLTSGYMLAICSIIILILLVLWGNKDKRCGPYVILIIFGAIGNIIDRFTYGYVVDFLDFFIGGYHWPAFNIADCVIVFGNINLLLIFSCDNKELEDWRNK